MSTPIPVAITGVTGAIGGAVARELSARGISLRLLARSPERAPHLPDSTVHRVSYDDGDAAVEALRGVETLFMVSAIESPQRIEDHRTFIDAAVTAGVQRVVYTSFMSAAPDAIFTFARDHFHTEEYIKNSGLEWTFLRDCFYIDVLEHFVGEDGVIRGPGGEGKAAFVARADVSRVATEVLALPAEHVNATYDLTGPQSLTFAEAARTISEIRGTEVTYLDETLDEAYESRASYGAPDWEVEAWVTTYTAIASGDLAPISDSVSAITGSAPITLEEHLRDTPQ